MDGTVIYISGDDVLWSGSWRGPLVSAGAEDMDLDHGCPTAQSRKPPVMPVSRSHLQELSAHADILNRVPSHRSRSLNPDVSDARISKSSGAPSLTFSDSTSADSLHDLPIDTADESLHHVWLYPLDTPAAEAEICARPSVGKEQKVLHVGAQFCSNPTLLPDIYDAKQSIKRPFPATTRGDNDIPSIAVMDMGSGSRVQEPTTSLRGSATTTFPQPPTPKLPRIQVSDVSSPPWNQIPVVANRRPTPMRISNNEECNDAQQTHLNVPNFCDNLNRTAEGFSTSSVKTCWPVTPHDNDQDADVDDDDDDDDYDDDDDTFDSDMNMADELKTFFGPETARSIIAAIANFAPVAAFKTPLSNLEGLRQHAPGSGNAPASSPEQSTQPSSSPITTRSSNSGRGKRTAPTSDGAGDEAGDDGSNDKEGSGKSNKRQKTREKQPQTRWDCPLARRPIGDIGPNPGCAKNGLEFRNLWEHFRQHHYGCEICGLKLSGPRADVQHLNQRQKDPSVCSPGLYPGPKFEIGIDLYEEMYRIYKSPLLETQTKKWAEWWKKFFPDHSHIPDGIHQGTISFPSADIPALQAAFSSFWNQEALLGNLPPLTISQEKTAQQILDQSLRALTYTHQPRFRTASQLSRDHSVPEAEPSALTSWQALLGVEQNPFLNALDTGISPQQSQLQPYQPYGNPGF